ncbi:MAG: DUF937 domain-containing protein [Richelia sp. RM2_1_2]|nr:DUF937 domain-containing protein [Richelia sp. SM1_7_0]NJN10582.1 DUF937 domain-containing protein [Richelia sp. RM1_1_1]NJO29965.1 DUF937 domain-containing protein [Richelia sp. SL_2_1]NJO62248.1 DUF937 domain-containing protein [Richelia sp. RM2_1_2]
MGLFDEVLSAINSPDRQGSMDQIGSILNTVQQLSGNAGTDSSTMESAMGIVGNFVRSSLQEKRVAQGEQQAQSIVNQFSGTSPNSQAVNAIFSSGMQQQVAQAIAQRTGLDVNMALQMLPMLVPLVLQFLQSGASSQNPQSGENSVLHSFLDADGDGNVDISDAIQLASRFMKR